MAALILWYVYAHACKLSPERTFSMSSRYSGEQSSGALQRNQACTTADLKNWFYIEFFIKTGLCIFKYSCHVIESSWYQKLPQLEYFRARLFFGIKSEYQSLKADRFINLVKATKVKARSRRYPEQLICSGKKLTVKKSAVWFASY